MTDPFFANSKGDERRLVACEIVLLSFLDLSGLAINWYLQEKMMNRTLKGFLSFNSWKPASANFFFAVATAREKWQLQRKTLTSMKWGTRGVNEGEKIVSSSESSLLWVNYQRGNGITIKDRTMNQSNVSLESKKEVQGEFKVYCNRWLEEGTLAWSHWRKSGNERRPFVRALKEVFQKFNGEICHWDSWKGHCRTSFAIARHSFNW